MATGRITKKVLDYIAHINKEAKAKAEKEAAAKYKEENFIKPEDWNGPR